jgi:uncharacterized membrane protein
MNSLIWAALMSMTPFGELRLGIPVALASHINPWVAYFVCVGANIIIVPITYFFLEVIHHRLLHVKTYQSLFDKSMEKTRVKVKPLIDKYGMFGLAVFVAVPIPGTGAYAGTLGAWFFGMNKWKAFLSIAIGVVVAGAIMMGGVLGGLKLIGLAFHI